MKGYKMMHEKYMRLALELALKAQGRTSPNPMVGAVIVKDGEIIGTGYHLKAGTPHAEVHALRQAGAQAEGATMYVSLEPCSHYGKTPPCTEAVVKAGLKEVFVAMQDPNPKVAGKGIKQIVDTGIQVHVGLMENEAQRLNEAFIKYITKRTPFVLLKTAMTLDGKIATSTGHSRWITGDSAREMVHQLRDSYDAILVGVNTIITDNPALTCRLPEGGRDPIRIVMDSKARTPVDAQVLTQESTNLTYIAVIDGVPDEKLDRLIAAGVKIIKTTAASCGRVDIKELMHRLGEMEIISLLVEGGAEVAASFLEAEMVDKVLTFIAPKIIGGKDAPGPVGGHGKETMDQAIRLKNVRYGQAGDDFFVEGYIKSDK
jgi:diaminohydroxyphosphoribosylaminopyrimidine deaminase/5-amino-6-(5-phosphoribosylamino)uracil reductase